ncbi:MAG: type II toxin-antitoxin system MqsA family antitoxin [Chitinophagales bacterium]|nr:type II toxin-antitoxin system MqsA family antitoxin [Chitinophagales bacterium]
MNCLICKSGVTEPGIKNFMLERDNSIVIVKGVPAQVCSQCGEAYFDASTTKALYEQAQASLKNNPELEVIKLHIAA